MNTAMIAIAAATVVSMITDDLRISKKATTAREAHLEHDAAANMTMGDSDLTSTTTATTESSVSNTPE
eukprot:5310279-Ditylum_brightwellii.AAC.1